jgi:drug/metabolite transporter (DMT)-like permease
MKYLLLILVGLIWGSQYVLNDIILSSFTPLGLTAIRMFIGFMTLSFLIMIIPSERKKSLNLTPSLLKLLLIVGITEAAVPFTFIAFGQTQLSSSMAAIILGVIPMITIVLHSFALKTHRITKQEVLGMSLAFIGLVVLINPSADSLQGTLFGYGALFIAAISFAVSFIYMDKIPHELSALHVSRFVLMVYSIPFVIVWWFTNDQALPTDVSVWGNLALLGVFASGFIYVLYIKLVRLAGPTFASLSNYIVPLSGTFLGVFILSEPFTYNIAVALVLITFSLVVINLKKKNED